jgi:RNA polymerase sigma-70 factor (ECF subfamily)
MEKTDDELLAAYRAGDPEALGELVERYKKPLYSFILRMTGPDGDPDEIFQEVWLRAIKNMHRYKHNRFLSWMFRITRNLIIDRSRRKTPDCSLQDPLGGSEFTLEQHLSDEAPDPADMAGGRMLGQRIEAAAERLPLKQREVFWLRMQAQLSFKEIARIQKCSINTALARMQYALQKMREELDEVYDEYREAQL